MWVRYLRWHLAQLGKLFCIHDHLLVKCLKYLSGVSSTVKSYKCSRGERGRVCTLMCTGQMASLFVGTMTRSSKANMYRYDHKGRCHLAIPEKVNAC